ncbi:MAG: ABC transporter ATP-binding protein [Clostridiales bacterium]|nr:ABC transporter ATP-binding protein [Clostridiales bacterium]
MSLLEINHLTTEFKTAQGVVKAVRGIHYRVNKGEVLGIVGESGSGKSVGMLSLMGLLASNGTVTSGEILFDGEDISPVNYTTKKEKKEYQKKMQKIRGNDISMIFQDPMSYLNPIVTIGKQMTEGILYHTKCSKKEAETRAVELMKMVGIPAPESRLKQYPFEFSGGMRQRIIIAIALACNPKLIIADEPTTALDVTVQAQILDLLRNITKESDAGVIIITHDLGVVASLCDRISIMYGGDIMEEGTVNEIFYEAKHPYTKGLLNSIANSQVDHREPLKPIPGTPPDLIKLKDECPFAARCSEAMEICTKYNPLTTKFSDTHSCKCWMHCKDRYKEVVKGDEAHE